jgi:DNA-binding CsgD family transcriptional regulator
MRVSANQCYEIVTLYRQGIGLLQIAARLGLHRSTITKALMNAGIEKSPPVMSVSMIEQVKRLSAQGVSQLDIA